MFNASFSIEHVGCWGSEINLMFPDLSFTCIDCRWVDGKVADVVLAEGNATQFKDVINYLSARRDVTAVQVLSEDKRHLCFRVLTKGETKTGQFSNIFFDNHCFPIAPPKFKDKYEIWTLASSEKKNLTNVYNYLKKKYNVKVNYLKESSLNIALTDKQRQALTQAQLFGYYEWPRKTNATKIAKAIKTSKTAFLSNLRKAESKILSTYTK